ncbi:MATE family efflux transporter [Phaeobacter sp. NW0010-22]|uniref:MATE family efflux transporter n=1 Tax=Phaeobacter sp. NW0010-22 TaxID=3135907 RepID=UPI00310AC6A8
MPLSFLGAGIGIVWPHLNTFILQLTDVGERDLAASALSTAQMYAVAFGTALAGLVGNLTGINDTSNLAHIANSAIWLFCLFGFAAALAVVASRKLVADLKAKHHESAGS